MAQPYLPCKIGAFVTGILSRRRDTAIMDVMIVGAPGLSMAYCTFALLDYYTAV